MVDDWLRNSIRKIVDAASAKPLLLRISPWTSAASSASDCHTMVRAFSSAPRFRQNSGSFKTVSSSMSGYSKTNGSTNTCHEITTAALSSDVLISASLTLQRRSIKQKMVSNADGMNKKNGDDEINRANLNLHLEEAQSKKVLLLRACYEILLSTVMLLFSFLHYFARRVLDYRFEDG